MVPAAAACLVGASIVDHSIVRNAYAEAPAPLVGTSFRRNDKKPIYDEDDDDVLGYPTNVDSARTFNPSRQTTSTPAPQSMIETPTERLARQIRRMRLLLYAYASAAEDGINDLLTSALDLETSVTTTVASLGPPKESGEKLLPGVIYVLVAAMAGSIVSRNRNILVRAAMPLAAGIGASSLLLPITSRNVGDLVWRYEQKVPIVRENHLRVRGAAIEAWRIAQEQGQRVLAVVDQTAQGGRQTLEEWVRKGR